MKFTAEISLDNDEAAGAVEFALPGYLERVAAKVRDAYTSGPVMDGNGNRIGYWQISDD